jgi:tRNA(fMet)-specific endonuclease VapC
VSESTSPSGFPRSSRFLLDTNILIAAIDRDSVVLEMIARSDASYVPAPALGELYYGAAYSKRWEENARIVGRLVAGRTVLAADADTALWYGQVKGDLRRRGRMIPENDVWIAALALQHDLTLATRDAHFAAAAGLRTVRWEGT